MLGRSSADGHTHNACSHGTADAADLAPSSETGKPVWAALKNLNATAGSLANGAALQDDNFHGAMGDVLGRTAAAVAALELSGAEDQTVADAVDKLIAAVSTLQNTYSKTAARKRQGEELSAQDRAKLDKVRANQAELQKKLHAMEAKIQVNKRALESVKEVRRRSETVSNSGNDLASFLTAMVALRIIGGLLCGSHWYWGPWGGWYPSYSRVLIDIHEETWIDIEYDWDY